MNKIEVFELSKLGGDPDDCELFQFNASVAPIDDCFCYLSNDKIADVAHGVEAFLNRTDLDVVEISLGRFEQGFAGAAARLRLRRQEGAMLLAIDYIDEHTKKQENVRHIDGVTSSQFLNEFLAELALLGSAHSGVARLKFTM